MTKDSIGSVGPTPTPGRRRAINSLVGGTAALVSGGCSFHTPLEPPGSDLDQSGSSVKRQIRTLDAKPAFVRLVPDARPETAVWTYGGTVPGTPLTVRQGDSLNINFQNRLAQASTVHWHGIRIANAMDGVPHLTQPPVKPGETFRYHFALPDAGTYWYHPHLGTPEQVGRGLYGALIVQEPEPPLVDRDIVWLIDDWRLDGRAQITEDFYKWGDVAFGGRVGNTVTVNGMEHHSEPVAVGERIRLRLINAANARLFSLQFEHHPTWIIALDGNPLPRAARVGPDQNVFLGPGQRADLIIDMTGGAGEKIPVIDRFKPNSAYPVGYFQYAQTGATTGANASRVRMSNRPAPLPIQPNSIAEPARNERLLVGITLDGGMMREPAVPWTQRLSRRMRQWSGSREANPSWSLNGRAHMVHGKNHPFEFTADRGQTVQITYKNRNSHWHPMHLHGHAFRELSRNGRPVPMTPWRDTSVVAPHETLAIAFVADNPGDWLIHCHNLEHHAGGMGTQFRVRS